jgi:hypothetical protein
MKAMALAVQITALTFGFAANRADAMAGSAIFAVLCVIVVILDQSGTANNARTTHRLNSSR